MARKLYSKNEETHKTPTFQPGPDDLMDQTPTGPITSPSLVNPIHLNEGPRPLAQPESLSRCTESTSHLCLSHSLSPKSTQGKKRWKRMARILGQSSPIQLASRTCKSKVFNEGAPSSPASEVWKVSNVSDVLPTISELAMVASQLRRELWLLSIETIRGLETLK